jgi:hypothetical protein
MLGSLCHVAAEQELHDSIVVLKVALCVCGCRAREQTSGTQGGRKKEDMSKVLEEEFGDGDLMSFAAAMANEQGDEAGMLGM